eukprot:3827301-Rhodomonas_salina.3
MKSARHTRMADSILRDLSTEHRVAHAKVCNVRPGTALLSTHPPYVTTRGGAVLITNLRYVTTRSGAVGAYSLVSAGEYGPTTRCHGSMRGEFVPGALLLHHPDAVFG